MTWTELPRGECWPSARRFRVRSRFIEQSVTLCRYGHSAVVINGSMWLFGGFTLEGTTASDVWRYDIEAGTVRARACELCALRGAILPRLHRPATGRGPQEARAHGPKIEGNTHWWRTLPGDCGAMGVGRRQTATSTIGGVSTRRPVSGAVGRYIGKLVTAVGRSCCISRRAVLRLTQWQGLGKLVCVGCALQALTWAGPYMSGMPRVSDHTAVLDAAGSVWVFGGYNGTPVDELWKCDLGAAEARLCEPFSLHVAIAASGA